jgi:hypothetical protein
MAGLGEHGGEHTPPLNRVVFVLFAVHRERCSQCSFCSPSKCEVGTMWGRKPAQRLCVWWWPGGGATCGNARADHLAGVAVGAFGLVRLQTGSRRHVDGFESPHLSWLSLSESSGFVDSSRVCRARLPVSIARGRRTPGTTPSRSWARAQDPSWGPALFKPFPHQLFRWDHRCELLGSKRARDGVLALTLSATVWCAASRAAAEM